MGMSLCLPVRVSLLHHLEEKGRIQENLIVLLD